jgi:ABC-type transport system involved in cytochrome bd biosynthesis fused ATPase/permease subunit
VADAILVLDNGAEIGYGTHNDLMASCETYADIYRSQVEGTIGTGDVSALASGGGGV